MNVLRKDEVGIITSGKFGPRYVYLKSGKRRIVKRSSKGAYIVDGIRKYIVAGQTYLTHKKNIMTYTVNLIMQGCYGKKVYPNFKYTPSKPTTIQAVKELEVVFPSLISVEFL